jgi:hypothetical protein
MFDPENEIISQYCQKCEKERCIDEFVWSDELGEVCRYCSDAYFKKKFITCVIIVSVAISILFLNFVFLMINANLFVSFFRLFKIF